MYACARLFACLLFCICMFIICIHAFYSKYTFILLCMKFRRHTAVLRKTEPAGLPVHEVILYTCVQFSQSDAVNVSKVIEEMTRTHTHTHTHTHTQPFTNTLTEIPAATFPRGC